MINNTRITEASGVVSPLSKFRLFILTVATLTLNTFSSKYVVIKLANPQIVVIIKIIHSLGFISVAAENACKWTQTPPKPIKNDTRYIDTLDASTTPMLTSKK